MAGAKSTAAGARAPRIASRGVLATPMRPMMMPGLLASEADVKAAIDARSAKVDKRMMLLCDHYGIAPGDWYGLALGLARDHVPGLQTMKARPGAKTKWDALTLSRLKAEMDLLADERKCSHAQAARILLRRDPWRAMAKNADSLLRRAKAANLAWTAVLIDAIRYRTRKTEGEPITLADLARLGL